MAKKILYIFLILLFAIPALATDYYVDFTATGNDTGTSPTNAFSSWSALNSALIHEGSSVYFKNGKTFTLTDNSDRFQVTFSGTAENPSIIGCYDSEGDFDCGTIPGVDANRPIISGASNSYPTGTYGAFDVDGKSYVTIQDIKFNGVAVRGTPEDHAGAKPIKILDASYINVDNCYFYRSGRGAIEYGRTAYGTISDNYLRECGYPSTYGSGAVIEVTSLNTEGATHDIKVTRNHISGGRHEGIGFYKHTLDCIAEYNVVHGTTSYHIYNGDSKGTIFRYNLVYEDTETYFDEDTYGIASDVESWRDTCYNDELEIYGNLIANMSIGINLSCNEGKDGTAPACICYDNSTLITNNTLVGNDINIRISYPQSGDDITIKNNLSKLYTAGTHMTPTSPAGVTFSNNLYHGSSAVSGNAATNAVTSDPLLTLDVEASWASIVAGSLDGTEFTPSTGSPALGAGQTITNYMTFITASDFTANPISVTVDTDADGPAPIGAWNTGYIPDPEPPTPDDAIGMAIVKGNLLAVKGNLVAGYQAAVTPAATAYSDALSERTPASNPLGDGWTQTDGTAVTSTIAAITTPAGFSNYAWQITGVSTDYPLIRFNTGLAGEDTEVLMLLYRDDALQVHAASRIPASAADADDAYTGGYRNYSDFARTYKALSGSYSILDTVSHGLTPYDTWLWLRYKTDGTTLYVRCWEDGSAEPGTWLITTTGQSDLTTGKNGIMLVSGNLTYSAYIAYYSVGVGSGVAAPSP